MLKLKQSSDKNKTMALSLKEGSAKELGFF
jgi:hypothetical protein